MIKRLGQTMSSGPMSLSKSPRPNINKPQDHKEQHTKNHLNKLLQSFGVNDEEPPAPSVEQIRTGLLKPGKYQPRQFFDDESIEDLAESIRSAGGIIQPLIVRSVGHGRFEIVAGERRWRAAGLIDMETVPCIIRDDIGDEKAIVLALVENLQREDLNPIEAAVSISKLITQFAVTHQQAANAIGKSRAHVTNLLRLLELPAPVIEALRVRDIDMGHARALLGLDELNQLALLETIVKKKLNVRDVENRVKRLRSAPPANMNTDKTDELDEAAEQLSNKLGAWVEIRKSSAGRVTIVLRTTDSLTRLLSLITG